MFCDRKLGTQSIPYAFYNQVPDLVKFGAKSNEKLDSILSQLISKKTATSPVTQPLKEIYYPPELIQEFIKRSEPNTKKNIETCGILCGIKKDAYYITNIFIPPQSGTSDTCITTNYEVIDHYVSERKLITLGWIHTHPNYTCFLSSIDLHTQYGYQKLLPEAIAVVYSGLNVGRDER